MKYAQLDTRAQERARDKWREAGQHDEWWDSVYADAITIGNLIGIQIGTETVKTTTGKSYEKPDINFSGFHHQGSYCSFGGVLSVAGLQNATEKMREHVGTLDEESNETLLTICTRAEAAFETINAHWVANRLSGLPEDEWDDPECTPTLHIAIDNRNERCKLDSNELPEAIEEDLNNLVGAFADWIYENLEAEDEHLNSDEYIVEGIEANEPDFDEDGNFE